MKRSQAVFLCLIMLAIVWVWNVRLRTPAQANAQDVAKPSKVEPQAKPVVPQRDSFEWSPGHPYPNFNLDEVIERLKTEIETLAAKKQLKSADDLRQNLDRTTFPAKLPMPLTKEIAAQDLYRKTIESVFLVVGLTRPKPEQLEWRTAFSTAFVVQEDGVLSTSAHVFNHDDHDDAVIACDVNGNVYPVTELLASNTQTDTCLFRIAAKNLKPLTLGQNLPPGSEIRVIGHPGDSLFFFTAGHISNYEHDEDGQTWMNITADFGQGSSGGPVMDVTGNVVGQVSRTYTLYAGGDTSNRSRRFRRTQQKSGDDLKNPQKKEKEEGAKDDSTDKFPSADPQMVFKACTPVSAIRALVK